MGKMTLKQIDESIKIMDIDKAVEELELLRKEYGEKLDKLVLKYQKKKASFDKEFLRYDSMCQYEKDGYKKGFRFIAGVDEVGRGPLAGPVVAAAVILPEGIFISGINDSKKLSQKQRNELFDLIMEKSVDVNIGMVGEKEIDEINILNATKKAMKIAINGLANKPDLLLTDAVELEGMDMEQRSIIKGDTLSISIAAASIIAKVTRDKIIDEMDSLYPNYGFTRHKGYGTSEHINSIKKYGICPIHRISFTKNFVS